MPKELHKCITPYCRNHRAGDRRRCHKCHMRNWRGNNPEKAAYYAIRDHAKERRILFRLLFEEFLQVIEGTGYIEKSGSRKEDLQIDRVDATAPYEFTNIHVVTCSENAAKSNWERHLPEHKLEMIRRKRIGENQPF